MSDPNSVRAVIRDIQILGKAWQRHLIPPGRLQPPTTGIPRVDAISAAGRAVASGFFGARRLRPYFSPFEAQRIRLQAASQANRAALLAELAEFRQQQQFGAGILPSTIKI